MIVQVNTKFKYTKLKLNLINSLYPLFIVETYTIIIDTKLVCTSTSSDHVL